MMSFIKSRVFAGLFLLDGSGVPLFYDSCNHVCDKPVAIQNELKFECETNLLQVICSLLKQISSGFWANTKNLSSVSTYKIILSSTEINVI